MSSATNFVEILASVYLLAIVGALVYANVRAFVAKRGGEYLFSGRRREGRLSRTIAQRQE
jgi:hypothetical protein